MPAWNHKGKPEEIPVLLPGVFGVLPRKTGVDVEVMTVETEDDNTSRGLT